MPRRARKKKSDLSQWPPLTFVSSPLYQPAPVLEQEAAATNPVTAKTVPIDDLTESVWVSPQFSQLGHRMLRSSLSSCRRINSALLSNKQSKFRPLQFLREEISPGDPPVRRSKRLEPVRLETILAQTDKGENCDAESGTNAHTSHAVRAAGDLTSELDIDKENSDQHSALTTPERSDRVLRAKGGRCVSLNISVNTQRKTRLLQSENACLALQKGAQCKDKQDLPPALEYQSITEDSSIDVPCPANCSTPSRLESDSNELLEDLKQLRSIENPILSSSIVSEEYLSTISNNLSLPKNQADGSNLRSKARILPQTKFLSKTPPRCASGSRMVLAVDTPECDYGLSLRQRQLKYGLREEMIKSHREPP